MGARIFVVEDEQLIVADLEAKLTRMGHEMVGTAASGEEAIRLAETLRPELVLMDISIQGSMDGRETARHVQAVTGAPVIFITAYAQVFLSDPTLMVPPGLCLSKPFSMHQLQTVLDAVLEKRTPS